MAERPARIAVVIPARDAAATIAATLRSVLAQTLAPVEIVVVDDGSTDTTAQEVAAFAARHRALRVLRIAPSGPSAARNAGIRATRAPFVAPLDADDVWAPEYLSALSAALLAMPAAGFAWCWHHLIDTQGKTLRGPMRFRVAANAYAPLLLSNIVGNGSSALFRRSCLEEAGGYRPVLPDWPGGEDYALLLRVAARHPVASVARDLVGYRKGAGTLSSDARQATRARLAAVRQAIGAFGTPPLPVLRWVQSDALRVEAVACLTARAYGRAARLAAAAVVRDPVASLRDGALRLGNRVRRLWGRRASLRPLDRLLVRRMTKLASYEAMTLPRQPSIRPTTCTAK